MNKTPLIYIDHLGDLNHLIDYMSFYCNEIIKINKDIEQTDYIIREHYCYQSGRPSAAHWPQAKKLLISKFRGNIDLVVLENTNYNMLNKANNECLTNIRENIKKLSDRIFIINNSIIYNSDYKYMISKMTTSLHKLNESNNKK